MDRLSDSFLSGKWGVYHSRQEAHRSREGEVGIPQGQAGMKRYNTIAGNRELNDARWMSLLCGDRGYILPFKLTNFWSSNLFVRMRFQKILDAFKPIQAIPIKSNNSPHQPHIRSSRSHTPFDNGSCKELDTSIKASKLSLSFSCKTNQPDQMLVITVWRKDREHFKDWRADEMTGCFQLRGTEINRVKFRGDRSREGTC